MFFQTSCFDNPAEKIASKVKNVLEKLRKKMYVYKFWKTQFSPNCFPGIVESTIGNRGELFAKNPERVRKRFKKT